MGIDFGALPETTGERSTRVLARSRVARWGVPIGCAAAAIVVFAAVVATRASIDTGNLWVIATLPLWVTAGTAHIWRRPGSDEGLEVLVFYRRLRRVALRTAVVSLYAAFVLLWIASYWHLESTDIWDRGGGGPAAAAADSGHYRFFSGLWWWPLVFAVLAIAAEPVLARVFAGSARDAMRRVKAARAWERVYKQHPLGWRGAGFDIERGAAGRPMLQTAGHWSPKLPPSGEARAIRPLMTRALALTARQSAALDGWWNKASLAWDGRRLVATDGQGVEREIPLARDVGPAGVTEAVWYTERQTSDPDHLSLAQKLQYTGLLFLDARGCRIGQMSGLGFGPGAVGEVAKAAGLEYAAYDLGGSARDPLPLMSTRLFPGRRRAVTIRAR